MSAPILCPECHLAGMQIVAAVYEPTQAPAWLRLLSMGLIRVVRARSGYDGFCAHCGERFCCGYHGAHDTWRRKARLREPAETGSERPPQQHYDPAGDVLIRTERDHAR